MDIDRSTIVRSTAGRDKGRLFFVLDIKDNFAVLADGKIRRVENPKVKKVKHIEYLTAGNGRVADKIKCGDKVTNSELRKTLAEFVHLNGEV